MLLQRSILWNSCSKSLVGITESCSESLMEIMEIGGGRNITVEAPQLQFNWY